MGDIECGGNHARLLACWRKAAEYRDNARLGKKTGAGQYPNATFPTLTRVRRAGQSHLASSAMDVPSPSVREEGGARAKAREVRRVPAGAPELRPFEI